MHRDAKTALGILAFFFIVACLLPCVLTSLPAEDNSVAEFRRYYGTSKEELEAVGRVYGVELDDFSDYGPQPFPINYISHVLGRDRPERPTVYRSDVDSIVKGYISKCELSDTSTIYLFYSDRLSPKSLVDDEALIMGIRYELNVTQNGIQDDQVLQAIGLHIIGDSGELDWELIAPQCTPPARYVSCLQFFGYCIRTP